MVSFKGQFKLQPHPQWSPFRGVIFIFWQASPLLLYGSPPTLPPPSPTRQILTLPWKRDFTQKWLFSLKRWKYWIVHWSIVMKKLTADAKHDPAVPFLVLLTIFFILRMLLLNILYISGLTRSTCWLNTRKVFYVVNKITYMLLFIRMLYFQWSFLHLDIWLLQHQETKLSDCGSQVCK